MRYYLIFKSFKQRYNVSFAMNILLSRGFMICYFISNFFVSEEDPFFLILTQIII